MPDKSDISDKSVAPDKFKAKHNLPGTFKRNLVPAFRTALASAVAYLLSVLLHLPEGYWAALTAIVVSRPVPGAALRAGTDRMLGTILGAGIGCLASFGRFTTLPDFALLLLLLTGTALVTAFRDGYRTAPIAGLIVFSAMSMGHSPVTVALLRVVEIVLGGAVGVAFTWVLLPRRVPEEAVALARRVHHLLTLAMEASAKGDKAACAAARTKAGREIYNLAAMEKSAPWERSELAGVKELHSALNRLNLSVGFASRTILEARGTKNDQIAEERLQERIKELGTLAPPAWPSKSILPGKAGRANGPDISSEPAKSDSTARENGATPEAIKKEAPADALQKKQVVQARTIDYASSATLRDAATLKEAANKLLKKKENK